MAVFLRRRALRFGLLRVPVAGFSISVSAARCWRRTALAAWPPHYPSAPLTDESHRLSAGFFVVRPPGGQRGLRRSVHQPQNLGQVVNARAGVRGGIFRPLCAASEPRRLHANSVSAKDVSDYVVRSMNEWLPLWQANRWRKAGGKRVENMDLWEALVEAVKKHWRVTWRTT